MRGQFCKHHSHVAVSEAYHWTVKLMMYSVARLRQSSYSSSIELNGRHLADDIFGCISVNEEICILIKISLKFVPKDPIDNNPALVQIMVWRRIATSHYLNQCWPDSLTHLCGTRGIWVLTNICTKMPGNYYSTSIGAEIFLFFWIQYSVPVHCVLYVMRRI